jgi:flagellin-like protein
MKILKNAKALSPVVASIILIAVTVAVSIAVAAWMGALSFNFMNTEQLSFTNYKWTSGNSTAVSYFVFTVKNTGSTDLTVAEARVDGVVPPTTNCTAWPLAKGQSVAIQVDLAPANFTSSIQYEFTVITAKGNTFGPYIKNTP